MTGVLAVADLGGGRALVLVDGVPDGAELRPGAWVVRRAGSFR